MRNELTGSDAEPLKGGEILTAYRFAVHHPLQIQASSGTGLQR